MGAEVGNGSTGEEEKPNWGSSLPVESVQEIVRRDPTHIPERYLRNFESTTKDQVLPHLSSEIPVIDLSLLSQGNEGEMWKLDEACREWGFFQIINHGVIEEVLQKVKTVTAKFFELPLEEKNKCAMETNDLQGYGQAYVISEEQKLDWADLLMFVIYPTNFRKLRCWPTEPPEFIEAIEAYSVEMKRVAGELFASLSLLMGMEKDGLLKLHNEVLQAMRFNYCPTCCKPDQVVGLTPHSDINSLSILLQDDEVTGLQVRHSNLWVPVIPISNALVVNIGDVLEVWSNGRYKSIEHRAMTNASKARISIASFLAPQDDVEIEPLDQTMDSERVRMYKKMRFGDYLRTSAKRELDGKSLLQLRKVNDE